MKSSTRIGTPRRTPSRHDQRQKQRVPGLGAASEQAEQGEPAAGQQEDTEKQMALAWLKKRRSARETTGLSDVDVSHAFTDGKSSTWKSEKQRQAIWSAVSHRPDFSAKLAVMRAGSVRPCSANRRYVVGVGNQAEQLHESPTPPHAPVLDHVCIQVVPMGPSAGELVVVGYDFVDCASEAQPGTLAHFEHTRFVQRSALTLMDSIAKKCEASRIRPSIARGKRTTTTTTTSHVSRSVSIAVTASKMCPADLEKAVADRVCALFRCPENVRLHVGTVVAKVDCDALCGSLLEKARTPMKIVRELLDLPGGPIYGDERGFSVLRDALLACPDMPDLLWMRTVLESCAVNCLLAQPSFWVDKLARDAAQTNPLKTQTDASLGYSSWTKRLAGKQDAFVQKDIALDAAKRTSAIRSAIAGPPALGLRVNTVVMVVTPRLRMSSLKGRPFGQTEQKDAEAIEAGLAGQQWRARIDTMGKLLSTRRMFGDTAEIPRGNIASVTRIFRRLQMPELTNGGVVSQCQAYWFFYFDAWFAAVVQRWWLVRNQQVAVLRDNYSSPALQRQDSAWASLPLHTGMKTTWAAFRRGIWNLERASPSAAAGTMAMLDAYLDFLGSDDARLDKLMKDSRHFPSKTFPWVEAAPGVDPASADEEAEFDGVQLSELCCRAFRAFRGSVLGVQALRLPEAFWTMANDTTA